MSRTSIWYHWRLLFKSDNISINLVWLQNSVIYWLRQCEFWVSTDVFHTSSLDFNTANKLLSSFFSPSWKTNSCNMSYKGTLLSLWTSSFLLPWRWSKSDRVQGESQPKHFTKNNGVFLLFRFIISVALVFHYSLLRFSKINIKGHACPLKSLNQSINLNIYKSKELNPPLI